MKIYLATFVLFTFAACTTKDNSFKDAQGSNLGMQNGGVQTTGSPRAGESPMAGTVAGSTGAATNDVTTRTPVPSPTPTN